MNDAISGLAPVEKIGMQTMRLGDSVDLQGYSAQTAEQTGKAMEGALQGALSRPGQSMKSPGDGEGITRGADGMVDVEKSGMVSEGKKADADVETSLMDEVALSTRQLYVELGRWNIAWGIAKRVQRDSNQIMRGQ